MKNKASSYIEIIISILIISILSSALFLMNSSNRRINFGNLKTSNTIHSILNYIECFDAFENNPVIPNGFSVNKTKSENYTLLKIEYNNNKKITFIYLKRNNE